MLIFAMPRGRDLPDGARIFNEYYAGLMEDCSRLLAKTEIVECAAHTQNDEDRQDGRRFCYNIEIHYSIIPAHIYANILALYDSAA